MLGLPGEVLAFTKKGVMVADGVESIGVPHSDAGLDLTAVLLALGKRGMNEVLVEAGPTLAGAFVSAGLADELVIYQAPHLMGDAARGLFHLPGVDRMARRVALEIVDIRRLGPDLRMIARPSPSVPA